MHFHEFTDMNQISFLSIFSQNLRTTGHIESTLDGPLIAMLLRLPENAALSALEIFSSCDLGKMRSKSAYLAGILKKELTKLGLH